jgi:type IV secretory pathway TrbF-like protein
MDYRQVVTDISATERLAYQRMAQWRQVAVLSGCLAVGLLVGWLLTLSKAETTYRLVAATEEGHVRIVRLPEQGWTLPDTLIREQVQRWVLAVRSFGTDGIAIGHARLNAWNQARKPAQAWLSEHFLALPVTQVGTVAIRVVDREPGVPDVRIVPPTVGRTWEVYWQEAWTRKGRTTPERKAFLALIVVQVQEPTNDAEANHLGVFIESISVQSRLPADGDGGPPALGGVQQPALGQPPGLRQPATGPAS